MFTFFQCVGEAIAAKGVRGILGEIPFAGVLIEMGFEAHERWCRRHDAAQMRAELQAVAQAGADEVRQAARQVSEEVARGHGPAARDAIEIYLSQIPAAVRRTCRRLEDPSGRSLPVLLSLRRPEDLIPLLPTRPSRYKPGDRPIAGGNWELEELLGVGGFGEVWKARHPRLRNIPAVALKFCLNAEAAASLRHEAALLDQVMGHGSGAGIVGLRNAYLDSDPVCLEYDFVEGGELSGLISGWPAARRVAEAARIVARIAAIVGRMHDLKPPVVHRDLKPANVLVRRRADGPYDLLVADFGIGAVAAERQVMAERLGTITRGDLMATELRGACTPLYASPQQKAGDRPDPRDDVYSLGVVWFQLATGELGRTVGIDYADDLRDLGMPDDQVKLLGACVASKPDRRPPTATSLAERLEALIAPPPAPPRLIDLELDLKPAPKQKGELIVARFGEADHRTISDAIKAASPHTRIRVRPGTYPEGIVIDKPIEIVGDGPPAEIIIESENADALVMNADEAIVRGLTLRCRAGARGQKKFGVDIPKGRLILEYCDITSDSLACIGVHGSDAKPVVRHCTIHGGKEGGLFIYAGAQGLYEDCEVNTSGLAGIESRENANPTIRRCTVRAGKQCGILFGEDGRGLVEDCLVEGNTLAGLEVKKGGEPVVKRTKFTGGAASGAYIHDHGKGTFEDCEFTNNGTCGVSLKGFSDPVFRRCVIRGNTQSGVACYDGALGTFEQCELSENLRLGMTCYDGGNPSLRGCKIHGNKQGGVWAYDNARGAFEECDFFANEKSAVNISKGGHPLLRRCTLRDGLAGGLFVYESGKGLIEDCDIRDNTLANVEIREEGDPTLRNCRVHGGKASGVSAHTNGKGTLDRCKLYANTNSNAVIKTGADLILRGCEVYDGKASGVFVLEKGTGTMERCVVYGNTLAGIEVREGGVLTMRGCRAHNGKASGLFVNADGKALVEDCEFRANQSAGVVACERGEPTVRKCRVLDNKANGVFFYKEGRGLVEDCEVTGNEKAGFEVREGSRPTIRNCRVNRNVYEAMWFHDQGGGLVEGCDLTGNKRGAWDVAAGCTVTRRDNKE